jgi:hypothetical protein
MQNISSGKEFQLVLGTLTIESSYAENIERFSSDVADTVQFWISPSGNWRIRTFAVDHDIHVYQIQSANAGKFSADIAVDHIKKTYNDVISSIEVIEIANPDDAGEVQKLLTAHDLSGTLEVSEAGFAFYNPDNARYSTKSDPR